MNKKIVTNPIPVHIADGHINKSSRKCNVDVLQWPAPATEGHIVPGIQTHSLLSVSKMCESDCEVHFKKNRCNVTKDDTVILSGPRDPTTTLWKLPISPKAGNCEAMSIRTSAPPEHQTNLAHDQCSSTVSDLMQFLYLSFFSPKPLSWLKGIEYNQYVTYLNLTAHNVKKHLPKSTATAKGHVDKQRINIKSTKLSQQELASKLEDINPPQEQQTNNIFVALGVTDGEGTLYIDLTGKFPITAASGNKYILIGYDYDNNAIRTRPVQARNDHKMLEEYKDMYKHLRERFSAAIKHDR